MQEAESLSLWGSSAADYFCGVMGSRCRQGSDTNLIPCMHTELSPPGLAETFANNVIFGGRGGHVEPPSSSSCSSGAHCTPRERCGTDRQTLRQSWEEGNVLPSCCKLWDVAEGPAGAAAGAEVRRSWGAFIYQPPKGWRCPTSSKQGSHQVQSKQVAPTPCWAEAQGAQILLHHPSL